MALVSLLFKKPQKTEISRIVNLQLVVLSLDATIKESFVMTAEPTQHPVESGASITDHVILRPEKLSISGMITKNPFGGLADIVKAGGATVGATIGAALGPFGTAVGALAGAVGGVSLANSIFGSTDRDLAAVASEFRALIRAKQPVDIQTGLKKYAQYVLSSCSVSRDKTTGQSINLDLEFQEIVRVQSQITLVAIPKVKGAIQATNQGRQSKGNMTPDVEGKSSLLVKGLNFITGK